MAQRLKRTYPDLKAYFDESGENQADFAARLNRSQSWISRVKDRLLEPSLEEALLIAKLTGIPLESLIAKPSVDTRI